MQATPGTQWSGRTFLLAVPYRLSVDSLLQASVGGIHVRCLPELGGLPAARTFCDSSSGLLTAMSIFIWLFFSDAFIKG